MKLAGICFFISSAMSLYGLLQAKQAGHFFNILYYGFSILFDGLVFIGLSIQLLAGGKNYDNPDER